MEQALTVTPGTVLTVISDGITEHEALEMLLNRQGLARKNELLMSVENADGTHRVQVLTVHGCSTCGGTGTA